MLKLKCSIFKQVSEMTDQEFSIEQFDEAGDAAFRVTAENLEALFAACGHALSKLIFPFERTGGPLKEQVLALHSADLESLLVDFLSELIFLFDSQAFISREFQFQVHVREEQVQLVGQVHGFSLPPVGPGEQLLGFVPKGVSYHLLEVGETEKGWSAQFVLDG
jgi:SHS2 domain-containing protein